MLKHLGGFMASVAARLPRQRISDNPGVLQVIPYVSMAYSHDSLKDIAKSRGIDLTLLEPGQFVMFFNNKWDAFKLFGANNTFAYHRSLAGSFLTEKGLRSIPPFFDGKRVIYTAEVAKWAIKNYTRLSSGKG